MIAIVVLNYINYEDTIECVESIFHQKNKDYIVIIVENGSGNGSYEKLKEMYGNHKKVRIIQNQENLGFSCGNNVGIDYARTVVKTDIVLVVNNDTIFTDSCFLDKLYEEIDNKTAVIGPKIKSADGFNQNPLHKDISIEQLNREYRDITSKSRRLRTSFIYHYLKLIKRKLLSSKEREENINNPKCALHGSCFLLTPAYFSRYPRLYPKTFLYYEEDILYILSEKAGLIEKYIDSTQIFHKESQAAKKSFKRYSRMRDKYLLESIKVCREVMQMNYNEIKHSF